MFFFLLRSFILFGGESVVESHEKLQWTKSKWHSIVITNCINANTLIWIVRIFTVITNVYDKQQQQQQQNQPKKRTKYTHIQMLYQIDGIKSHAKCLKMCKLPNMMCWTRLMLWIKISSSIRWWFCLFTSIPFALGKWSELNIYNIRRHIKPKRKTQLKFERLHTSPPQMLRLWMNFCLIYMKCSLHHACNYSF